MQTWLWGVTTFPSENFCKKNTLNDKVNNWAVELETYRIKFVHIKGKSNVLANTLSRLISIDPDVKLEPELEGHEFRQYCFEELPKASSYTVNEIITGMVIETHDADITEPVYHILHTTAQLQNTWTTRIWWKTLPASSQDSSKGHLADSGYFVDKEDDLLWWRILDNSQQFEPVVLPNSLISIALLLAHNHTGHNGFRRTYAALKQLYYWKGIKKDVLCTASIVKCVQSRRLRKQSSSRTISGQDPCLWNSSPWIWLVDYPGLPVAMSMPSQVICMLTGYVFCIPLKTKTAEEIVDKYLTHVAFTFGNSRKILSDNDTEVKHALFEEMAKQLEVERKIYSPVYRPQANGRIEGFHKFLKECICKHMVNNLEWDDILSLAAAAYNWFPNEHSKEPAFFLMFGWDTATNFTNLIKPKRRYLGDVKGLLKIEQFGNSTKSQHTTYWRQGSIT